MLRTLSWLLLVAVVFLSATACGSRTVSLADYDGGGDLQFASDEGVDVTHSRVVARKAQSFDDSFGAAGAFLGAPADVRMVASAATPTPVASNAPTATPVSPLVRDRLLTKEGGIWLRVPNIDRAQEEAVQVIESEGGLIYKSQIGSLEARVPPERFEDTMDRLATIGVVAQRWTNIQDVTEEVADLDLRLGIAREGHGRLTDLLAKAEKVEDMLNIERELRRLTEEIERMEGQRRGITRRVESSTIKITIEQLAEAANQPRDTTSFPWIANTGINATLAAADSSRLGDTPWLTRVLRGRPFELGGAGKDRVPEGLVVIGSLSDALLAATPEDHRLRVRIVEPPQQTTLEFWTPALRRSLESVRGYEVLASGDAAVNHAKITGTRLETRIRYEGEIWRYNVWVLRKEGSRNLAVVEAAWRDAEAGKLEQIAREAVAGIELR
jgi:hypothetical protein